MIICQKVNATAHCVLESGKKCIAGEALLAQHDVKKNLRITVRTWGEGGGSVTVQHTHGRQQLRLMTRGDDCEN